MCADCNVTYAWRCMVFACLSLTHPSTPPQGRWRICGLVLPGNVLGLVYGGNARRLISGLAPE